MSIFIGDNKVAGVGNPGRTGKPGESAYEIAKKYGYEGTEEEFALELSNAATKPDWLEKNENSPSFIKNKPFGENEDGTIKTLDPKYLPEDFGGSGGDDCDWTIMKNKPFEAEYTVLLPEVTVETKVEYEGEPPSVGLSENFSNLVVGATYTVMFDGTIYNCVAKTDEVCTYIGNMNLFSEYDGKGDPFLIYAEEGWPAPYMFTATVGQHTISISGDKVTQISGKFVEGMGWSEKAYPDIEWDGNTEGLVAAIGGPYYKIMDWTSAEDLDGVTVYSIEGENAEGGPFKFMFEDEAYELTDGLYSIGSQFVWFAEKQVEFDGVEFPEAGLHFKKVVSEEDPWSSARISKLVAPDRIHYIDEKYIYKNEFDSKYSIDFERDNSTGTGHINDLKTFFLILFERIPIHFVFDDHEGNMAHIQFDQIIDHNWKSEATENGYKWMVSACTPISRTKNVWITITVWENEQFDGFGYDNLDACTIEYGYTDDSSDYLDLCHVYTTPF